jgi:outer membrane protein
MKKTFLLLAFSISLISCNKEVAKTEFKTAYVDTTKMMEDYTEAKQLDEKYKTKGEVMGRELEVAAKNLKAEMNGFQQNAMAKGQAWAQQKGSELQQRQQELQYAQQAMLQQLQSESAKEMDTLVKKVKQQIKDYGKDKGYDYIYGTGDAVSILYAKESYDITKDVTKMLNDKFVSTPKAESKEVKTTKK